jgi:hypothetical protein
MQPQALTQYIWQDIRKEVYADKIQLYLPFFFGSDRDEPLCLTWDRNGVLSDGGRTMTELKKRIPDITPYQESIRNIISTYGLITLVGGQNLTVQHYRTHTYLGETYLDYWDGLEFLLRVISQISVVDTITVDEDGTVRLL